MAQLIVHNPPTVKLKASGYTGTPTGDIELTENNRTYNVSSFATATTAIPEEEKTVTPSTIKQVITPDEGLLKKVTVNPTPLEEKTVTPTTEQQTILPQAPAIGFLQVTIEPVTPSIDPDIQPENIKQGVDILGVQGTLKPPGIPIDEDSQTPLYFGVHASGFVLSSNPADETPVAFGVNANGHPYVKGGTA